MARLNLAAALVDSRASAATDWGSAEIAGKAYAEATAEIRRGINLQVGAGAFAALDLAFRKYVAVAANAQAHAEVKINAQAQLPLNLFGEAGLAVRFDAVAEAAAGVSIKAGLVTGDFLELVIGELEINGIPLRLIEVLLEESVFSGGVYAKAAVAAMAYANVVVAGRAIPGSKPGEQPGFRVLAEAGIGFKAGAGYRAFVDIGIPNFRRYAKRSADIVVDGTIENLRPLLPLAAADQRTALDIMSIAAKIVLRSAFELGELAATGKLPKSQAARRVMARVTVEIALDETQKFIFERVVSSALQELRRLVENAIAALTGTSREAIVAPLEAFANRVWEMPDEPFLPDNETVEYWANLIKDTTALVVVIAPAGNSDLMRAASLLWAASDLLIAAMTKATRDAPGVAFASLNAAVGTGAPAFSGALEAQPPDAIKQFINTELDRAATVDLTRAEQIDFVVENALTFIGTQFPEVAAYLDMFKNTLHEPDVQRVARLVLSNVGPLIKSNDGKFDENATFEAIVGTIEQYTQNEIINKVLPVLSNALSGQPDTRLALDEVIVPALRLGSIAMFDGIRQWDSDADPVLFQENLSAILLTLLGRTVIVAGDVIVNSVQTQLSDELTRIAEELEGSEIVTVLEEMFPGDQSELVDIVKEALFAGADLLGPLPPPTRARLRNYMLQALSPLTAANAGTFAQSTADPLFVPNADCLGKLAEEYAVLTLDRLQKFIARLLEKAIELALNDVREIVAAAEELVNAWIGEMQRLANDVAKLVTAAAAEVVAAIRAVEEAIDAIFAELGAAFSALRDEKGRAAIRAAAASAAYDAASGLLFSNFVYAALPQEGKTAASTALSSIISPLIENAIVNDAMRAIGALTWDLQTFINDARSLGASGATSTALLNLLLNRVTAALQTAFANTNPGFNPSFSFSYTPIIKGFDTPAGRTPDVVGPAVSVTINLPRVELPLLQVIGALRSALENLTVLTAAADRLAADVNALFAAEQRQRTAEENRKAVDSQQSVIAQQLVDAAPRLTAVKINSPAKAAFYDADVPISIFLANVPRSFLGLGSNEQQRVFVHANGVQVALNRFDITEVSPELPSPFTDPAGPRTATVQKSSAFETAPAVAVRARDKVDAWGRTTARESTRVRMTYEPAAKQPLATIPVVAKGAEDKIPAGAAIGGGLELTMKMPASELRDGFNTIVVSIVDGHGTGTDIATSFLLDQNTAAPRTTPARIAAHAGSISTAKKEVNRQTKEITVNLKAPVAALRQLKPQNVAHRRR